MEVIAITTPILSAGDDLAAILMEQGDIRDGDIIVVSSKAIATVEDSAICLDDIRVTKEAEELSQGHSKSPEYYQAVLDETVRMNGSIIQSVNGIVLTALQPDGLSEGSILVPNAGLDQSNVAEGFVIGWPKDPVESACRISRELSKQQSYNSFVGSLVRWFGKTPIRTNEQTNKRYTSIAVIITDSGLSPRRKGVISFALAVSGFDPFASMIGKPDLFGHKMSITEEAVADQLATAANFLMGNTDQSTPAAVIRDHGILLNDFSGWVEGIEREKDIYHGVI